MASRLLSASAMKNTPPLPSSLPGLAGLAVIVACSACADSGQLGQSSLSAPCAAGASCERDGVSSPIAAGATFALEVKPEIVGGTAVPLSLRAVDAAVAVVEPDGKLRATGPGITAVLILTEDGGVVDLTHIAVQKLDRISFHRGGGAELDERELPEAIQLFPEEELTLAVRVWHGGQQLIGEMRDAWRVDNPAFRLLDQGFAQERRIKAAAAGSTTLAVDIFGNIHTLRLEVVP
jgi:hypothetical protein